MKLELNEANEQITQFKTYIDNLKASQTQSLFSELVQCDTSRMLQQSATIDLTGDDSSTSENTVRINCSKTKLKNLLGTENGFVTRSERFRDFGTEHEGGGALTSLDETSPT
ncbi:unnamed protein product [Parnassius mnemosyne]|uniref:Uncharacterized protein n=1 Tax=Parnassius mnemosyne TaxID=213953 RepID=A0AAV1KPR6_9NEOP